VAISWEIRFCVPLETASKADLVTYLRRTIPPRLKLLLAESSEASGVIVVRGKTISPRDIRTG